MSMAALTLNKGMRQQQGSFFFLIPKNKITSWYKNTPLAYGAKSGWFPGAMPCCELISNREHPLGVKHLTLVSLGSEGVSWVMIVLP